MARVLPSLILVLDQLRFHLDRHGIVLGEMLPPISGRMSDDALEHKHEVGLRLESKRQRNVN
jgi:hypothetical protein